jgi:hypothetical protein
MKKFFSLLLMLFFAVTMGYAQVAQQPQQPQETQTEQISINEKDPLASLPDASFLVIINTKQVAASPVYVLFTEFERHMMARMALNHQSSKELLEQNFIESIKNALLDQTQEMIMGADNGSNEFYLIAKGSFDESLLTSLFDGFSDRLSLKSETFQGSRYFILSEQIKTKPGNNRDKANKQANNKAASKQTSSSNSIAAFALLDANTLLISSPDGLKKMLEVRNGKRPSVLANEKMKKFLDKTDLSADVRLIMLSPTRPVNTAAIEEPSAVKPANPDEIILEASEEEPPPASDSGFEAIYGSVSLSTGMKIDGSVAFANFKQAKLALEDLNNKFAASRLMLSAQQEKDPRAAKALEVLNLIVVKNTDVDVNLSLTMPEHILRGVLEIMKETIH